MLELAVLEIQTIFFSLSFKNYTSYREKGRNKLVFPLDIVFRFDFFKVGNIQSHLPVADHFRLKI